MENGFGSWNVRSLYGAGSMKTAASELAKCDLDVVAPQDVRWDEGGSQPADGYTHFYGNGTADLHLGAGSFVHRVIN
jgi:hypothetical protein